MSRCSGDCDGGRRPGAAAVDSDQRQQLTPGAGAAGLCHMAWVLAFVGFMERYVRLQSNYDILCTIVVEIKPMTFRIRKSDIELVSEQKDTY